MLGRVKMRGKLPLNSVGSPRGFMKGISKLYLILSLVSSGNTRDLEGNTRFLLFLVMISSELSDMLVNELLTILEGSWFRL